MWVTFLYDGHVRNLTNLNYDIYVTFTLSSAIELPGDLLSIVVLEKLGRKWGSSICLFLSGVSIAICGLLIGRERTSPKAKTQPAKIAIFYRNGQRSGCDHIVHDGSVLHHLGREHGLPADVRVDAHTAEAPSNLTEDLHRLFLQHFLPIRCIFSEINFTFASSSCITAFKTF